MDDPKLFYKDKNVVNNIIKIIEHKYEKMSVTRGKKHTYIGMNIGIITLEM